MEACFIWWNAGMTVGNGKEAAARTRSAALDIIAELVAMPNLAVLGLCEVSVADLTAIAARVPPEFACVPLNESVENKTYDLGMIVRKDRVRMVGRQRNHAWPSETYLYMLGVGLNLEVDGVPIHLVLCHWPSRLYKPPKHYVRHHSGLRLSDRLKKVRKRHADWPIVVMGDFNDDPHDEALVQGLMAVRDRNRAVAHGLFYNHFWRRLGHMAAPNIQAGQDRAPAGTYYYNRGMENRWFTFDQVIVSPHCLAERPLALQEERTGPLPLQSAVDAIWSSVIKLDHLPIRAIFETPR